MNLIKKQIDFIVYAKRKDIVENGNNMKYKPFDTNRLLERYGNLS